MRQTFKKTLDAFVLTVTILFASTHAAFAVTSADCAHATLVELDSIYRGYAGEGAEVLLLDIPSAGIVALDVTVPGAAQTEPKLGFLGRSCSTALDPEAATVDQGVAHRTIAFRSPGEYYVRVASQDPLKSLAEYKFHSRFVAAEIAEDWFEMELGPESGRAPVQQTDFFIDSAAKVDEQEVDPNPNGFGAEPILSLVTLYDPEPQNVDEQEVDPNPNGLAGGRGTQKVDEQEVDPNPNGLAGGRGTQNVDEQEVDPNPNGLGGGTRALETFVMVPGQTEGSFELEGLCRNVDDDHGDVSACATSLSAGTAVYGQIANSWNDDVDVFSVEVSAPKTLLITSTGKTDTFGSLYDRFGQRLMADDNGSDGHNFRIVKSLDVGTYFIRVEGADRSQGAFGLTVESLDW